MKQWMARFMITVLLSILGAIPAAASNHGDPSRDLDAMRLLAKSFSEPTTEFDMFVNQYITMTIAEPINITMQMEIEQNGQFRGDDSLTSTSVSVFAGPEVQTSQSRAGVLNGHAYTETPDGWVEVPTAQAEPQTTINMETIETARLGDSGMVALERFQEVLVTYDPLVFKDLSDQLTASMLGGQLPPDAQVQTQWTRVDAVVRLDPTSGRLLSQNMQAEVMMEIQVGPQPMKIVMQIRANMRFFPAAEPIDWPDMTGAYVPANAVDALEWLRNDDGVLAPQRFDTSASAQHFVKRLYRAGATDVVVVDIYADPASDDPPYSEVLMVIVPEDADKRQAIFDLINQEWVNQGYEPNEDHGQAQIHIWWQ